MTMVPPRSDEYSVGCRGVRLLLVILLAVGFLRGAQCPAAEGFQIGVAKIDITPDYPIRLNGFAVRKEESEGVSQRIWAKALAISWGDEPPVVLVAIDSLGVRLPMVDALAAKLETGFGIPRHRVALTYSHSHSTPKVNGAADNIYVEPIPEAHQAHIDRYTRELASHLERAACDAVRDRRAGSLEWTVGKAGFAKNRRTPGGPVEHDLPLLVVRDRERNIRAIYTSYACHCVTLSHKSINGDWAGYAQEAIERRFPGSVALVSIGAGSDSNPSTGVVRGTLEVAMEAARAQGQEIADEVARRLKDPLHPITGPIQSRLQVIALPLNELPTREQWVAMAAEGGAPGYNATTQLARLDRGEKLITAIDYPIQSFSFGNSLQMVFLAGEVCVDYSLRLKRELDPQRLWINAYSNDFGCYVPSERLVKEGGYGGGSEIPYFALPATLKAGLEQLIIDEVIRQTPQDFRRERTVR